MMVVAPQTEAMMPDIVLKAFEATHASIKRQTDKIRVVEDRQDDLEDHLYEQLTAFRQILKQLGAQLELIQGSQSHFTRSSDSRQDHESDNPESGPSHFLLDSAIDRDIHSINQVALDNNQHFDKYADSDHAGGQDKTDIVDDDDKRAAIVNVEEDVRVAEQLLRTAERLGSLRFEEDLYAYHRKSGTPIAGVPNIAGCVIDLYKLYCLVLNRGGGRKVIRRALWRPLAADLALLPADYEGSLTTTPEELEAVYTEFLFPYETAQRLQLGGPSTSTSSVAMTPSAPQSSQVSQVSKKSHASEHQGLSFSLTGIGESRRPSSITNENSGSAATARASAKASDIYNNLETLDEPVHHDSYASKLEPGVSELKTKVLAPLSSSPNDRVKAALPERQKGVDKAVQTDESRLTHTPMTNTLSIATDASLHSREKNITIVETQMFERENRLEVEKAAMHIKVAHLEVLQTRLREQQKILDRVKAIQDDHEKELQERLEKIQRKEANIVEREGILSVRGRGMSTQEQAARQWRQEQELRTHKYEVARRAQNLMRAEEEWCQKTGQLFVPQTY